MFYLTRTSVGDDVGFSDGDAVEFSVGLVDGDLVGRGVVGEELGLFVGLSVGDDVGFFDGELLGFFIGEERKVTEKAL